MHTSRKVSEKLFKEAKTMFPGGVHSPVRAFKAVHGAPLFIKSASGAFMIDEDDQKYLDFCGSWGPLILGHKNPVVKEAILEALEDGWTYGAPNRKSNELGRFILDRHKYIDKIRFVSSGTEAVMSALRLARAYTGKEKIIKFEGCYHGHVDSLMVKAGSGLVTLGESTSAGIPEAFIKDTLVLPLGDLDQVSATLEQHKEDIAAIIIEPIPANNGLLLQDKSFLERLRELCTEHNVLLIFDEVISGFRVGFEGAAGYYDIQPDIITFGKILGGGMPVGAYAASHEIMSMVAPDGPMYQAGTLSANPISITAGLATLQICASEGFYENQTEKTTYFVNFMNDMCTEHGWPLRLQTVGSIFWFNFDGKRAYRSDQISSHSVDIFKDFHKRLLESGIYFGPSAYEVGFISHAHTIDDLDFAAQTMIKILSEIDLSVA